MNNTCSPVWLPESVLFLPQRCGVPGPVLLAAA